MSTAPLTTARTRTRGRRPTISKSSRSAAAAASRRPSSNSISTCRREALDAARLDAGRLYPEWDYRTGAYLPDHCRVLAAAGARDRRDLDAGRDHAPAYPSGAAALRGAAAAPRGDARPGGRTRPRPRRAGPRALRSARRQRRRSIGSISRCGRRGTISRSRSWSTSRSRRTRGSTDHRVLDVEKEALLVLAHGLVGLRRSPQHPHLHLAPAVLGAASKRSRRSASRWVRRSSGASAR